MSGGGEFLIVGLPDERLDGDTKKTLERLEPAGILLFAHNMEDEDQLWDLVSEIREVAPDTMLCVDQEGGKVDRLDEIFGEAPGPAVLSRHPASLSFQAGRWIGWALRLFDFDMNFAPVVDLDRGESENALDGRYFGSDPRRVADRAGGFLRGLNLSGVGGCLKHFPGLGGATEDTHHEGTVVLLPRSDLERDLAPFVDLWLPAGAVMISHAAYPAFDEERCPASLSPNIATKLLRDDLGFDGVAFSDDLVMSALEPYGDVPERAAAAFAAGCDLLIASGDLEASVEAAERLEEARFEARREEARERIGRLHERLATFRTQSRDEQVHDSWRRGADLDDVREKIAVVREMAEREPERA